MDTDPAAKPTKKPGATPWAMAFGMGTEMVMAVLICVFAGQWADKKLGTQPWLLLLGIFAGISLGLYQLLRKANVFKKNGP